ESAAARRCEGRSFLVVGSHSRRPALQVAGRREQLKRLGDAMRGRHFASLAVATRMNSVFDRYSGTNIASMAIDVRRVASRTARAILLWLRDLGARVGAVCAAVD